MQLSPDKLSQDIQKLTELLQEYPFNSVKYRETWMARQTLLYVQNPEVSASPVDCITQGVPDTMLSII
jgi:hypothetical protein